MQLINVPAVFHNPDLSIIINIYFQNVHYFHAKLG